MLTHFKNFVKKETVFCISALCAVITMFIVPPDAEYLQYIDFRVLCLLLCLMAVVAGFKSVGTFNFLTHQLLSKIHSGKLLGLTLVLLPFFCSMFITNDVALIIFIPFTLELLSALGCKKSVVPVIVLQTVGANLGSMATPVGNPQNLYLYSAYNLSAGEFFSVTLPLTVISLIFVSAFAVTVMPADLPEKKFNNEKITNNKKLLLYFILFLVCLLTVFRIIPYIITTFIVVLLLVLTDRKLIKGIDLMLLMTFVCFFIVSENLGRVEVIRDFLQSLLNKNTLLTSIGASQVISNVPAAVLLSGFTQSWRDLLAGVNIGGLGTPIASLASLITLKFYTNSENSDLKKFFAYFILLNVIGLLILIVFKYIFI